MRSLWEWDKCRWEDAGYFPAEPASGRRALMNATGGASCAQELAHMFGEGGDGHGRRGSDRRGQNAAVGDKQVGMTEHFASKIDDALPGMIRHTRAAERMDGNLPGSSECGRRNQQIRVHCLGEIAEPIQRSCVELAIFSREVADEFVFLI